MPRRHSARTRRIAWAGCNARVVSMIGRIIERGRRPARSARRSPARAPEPNESAHGSAVDGNLHAGSRASPAACEACDAAGEAREHRRPAGCRLKAAAVNQGISYRTACRWCRARKPHGPAGLEPRSTRPVRKRQKTRGRQEARAIVALRRRHPFMGVMGARPLRVLLVREGTALSRGAAGRIVRHRLDRRREPRRALPRSGRSRQAVPRSRSGSTAARSSRAKSNSAAPNANRPCTSCRPPVERPCRTLQRYAAPGVPGPSRRQLAVAAAPPAERRRWHDREGPHSTLAALDMRSPCERPARLESTLSSA